MNPHFTSQHLSEGKERINESSGVVLLLTVIIVRPWFYTEGNYLKPPQGRNLLYSLSIHIDFLLGLDE